MVARAEGRSVPWVGDSGHAGYAALSGSLQRLGGPTRRMRHPIAMAVAERFWMQDCTSLTGMRASEQAQLGQCLHEGRVCQFQWWFPYLGIAVDAIEPVGGVTEIATKREWCEERSVIYCSPADVKDLDMLREVADARRAANGHS